MALLSISLDLVALMRESGRRGEPDPCQAAVIAELAGADGIAVELKRSRKQIRDRDLYLLKGVIKTRFIVEMPPVDELIDKVLDVKPWLVVFGVEQTDADGPLLPFDFKSTDIDFSQLVTRFSGEGITVGFFVEPDSDQIKGASKTGAAVAMINCGRYSAARTIAEAQTELDRIDRAAQAAVRLNMSVHCGRGLNYKNVQPLVELRTVEEFLVGHAVCSRALLTGMDRAVGEMRTLVQDPRSLQ